MNGSAASAKENGSKARTSDYRSLRWTLVPVALLGICLQLLCVQLDLPVSNLVRNMFLPSKPAAVLPKYNCSKDDVPKLVTVVVTVKDACSQMPRFVDALRSVVGRETALILTYPRFKSCEPTSLGVDVESWRSVRTIALPPHSSPMRGWVEAAQLVDTKYALLLHNDGYAIDDFFACELVQSLEQRAANDTERYVVAAPMLYESKADGSLAAHATQSRLRVVDGVVRHDHSLARALNRGDDYGEGEQVDFLEDHGFLIEADKIATVVDPSASYTLEYIDMILTLKSKAWKVLFVPTARLEFRIAEFSWRDVPYFMYKRSEITCHGTRDYLARKWRANFPNTGFWTYIKYTIVESHQYPAAELAGLPWDQQAAIFLGFFQMAGYNQYSFGSRTDGYVALLEALDVGALEDLGPTVVASRVIERDPPAEVRNTTLGAEDLLPVIPKGWLPSIEADMPLEYLPFAIAELSWPSTLCENVLDIAFPKQLCGVAAQHSTSCSCWINLPTFKSHTRFMNILAKVASLMKLPSRVTTYLEMVLGSTNAARAHVSILEPWQHEFLSHPKFRIATCGGAKTATSTPEEPCEPLSFEFDKSSRVVHFSGRPANPKEVSISLWTFHLTRSGMRAQLEAALRRLAPTVA